MDKRVLRRQLRRTREELAERGVRSAAIHARLLALEAYRQAAAIHSYLSIGAEVDTHLLIDAALAAGRRVAVPVVGTDHSLQHSWIESLVTEHFVGGPLGTLLPQQIMPAAIGDWNLIIVPLLGFNRRGYRIGYGAGYYDRILASDHALAIGVAFACQELSLDFQQPHDQPLDLIVTEDELIVSSTDRRSHFTKQNI